MVSLTTNGAISHLFDVRSEQYTRSFLVHHARYSLWTSPTISKPDALGLMFVEEIQQDSSKKSSKLAFNPCSIPKGNRLTTRFFFLDFFFLDFFFLDVSVGFVFDIADGAGGGFTCGGGGTPGAGGAGTCWQSGHIHSSLSQHPLQKKSTEPQLEQTTIVCSMEFVLRCCCEQWPQLKVPTDFRIRVWSFSERCCHPAMVLNDISLGIFLRQ